ncbi:MAG: radical SAM protein, partial [Methanosarcinaceae archaeon]|nr:radical SAM protein [Methanosarcinaceae archaeon]
MFNLSEYLNHSMEQAASMSLRLSLESGKERNFILQAVGCQRKAAEKRRLSEEAGEHVPLFLIASIASECNLFCTGCYARANRACGDLRDQSGDGEMLPMAGISRSIASDLPASRWAEIFREAADIGIGVVILAGGEPLTRPDVLKAAAGVQELIFPVFTNGTMIGDKEISFFDENRHVIPVISIEGTQKETDERRGAGVYDLVRGKMDEL